MKKIFSLSICLMMLLNPFVALAANQESETEFNSEISQESLEKANDSETFPVDSTEKVLSKTPSATDVPSVLNSDADSEELVSKDKALDGSSTPNEEKSLSELFQLGDMDGLMPYLTDPEKYKELLEIIKQTTDYDQSGKEVVGNLDRAGKKQGVANYLGISPEKILNQLKSHENDNYYLGTPFRGLTLPVDIVMSPNGNPNGYGPGFNCTGFVARAFKDAGANINNITNVANAWGGVANAYNWRDALTRNVEYYSFDSVSALLNSGKAQKGDVIYFEPNYNVPNYDCHIGFFWGNNSSHNKMWHSYTSNMMSDIKSATPWTKIYLFKLRPTIEPNQEGKYIPLGKYVQVNSKNYDIFQNFYWDTMNHSSKVYKQTYYAKGMYRHKNGYTYYSLYDSNDNWKGYINKNALVETEKQGTAVGMDKYVKVMKKNYPVWSDFKWTYRNDSAKLLNKTLRVKAKYLHVNGSIYYSLYDLNGKWQGYINSDATKETAEQGPYIKYGKIVRVTTGNYNVFSNFSWNVAQKGSKVVNKTYLAKGKYNHSNGSTYYSLYDTNDKWIGYINANAAVESGKQGPYISYGKYVKVTKSGYDTYSDFNWKRRNGSASVKNKVYQARGKYNHFNGSTYLSLYDSNGKWQGYINADATKVSEDQGPYIKLGKYVFIKTSHYDIHGNFSWKKQVSGSKVVNKTYLAKGKYNHSNGATYYSLYDKNDKWLGYINSNATTLGGKEGQYVSYGKDVKITKKGYELYTDFNWKHRNDSAKLINKKFTARGKYNHFNGSTYLSLYDSNGKWQGYINADATKVV